MNKKINLTILTNEKEFFKGEVTRLKTRTIGGEIGILPDRAPLIAALKPTISEITKEDGNKIVFFSSNGLLKVKKNSILILCDACEYPGDIDLKRAEKAKERAKERLKSKESNIDIDRAKSALLRALTRIKTKDL